MGTRFVATEECHVHENYKQFLLKARDIDTRVTGRTTGHPVRTLRNPMTKEYLEKEVADYKLTLLEADNKTEVIEGKDISLKYVPGKQVEKLIKGQNPFLWIESLWKGRNMKAKIGVEYDESAYCKSGMYERRESDCTG